MIQAILNFFGLGKKDEPEVVTQADGRAVRKQPSTPIRPPLKKTSVRANNYYRRRGKYYSTGDDSLIDDLILLVVLDELFADGDIREFEEPTHWNTPEPVVEEPVEDLLDIDVSDTPVVASADEVINWKVEVPAEDTPPAATWHPEPEPVRESVSSGSSYSSGSSDYDSGSDDGGSDD